MGKIIQPRRVTYARYKHNIYAERILLRILEALQSTYKKVINKYKKSSKITKIETTLFGDKELTFQMNNLEPSGYRNYKFIKDALKALREETIEVRGSDCKGDYVAYTGLIIGAKFYQCAQKKMVSIFLSKDMIPYYMNLSYGYSTFLQEVAFGLKSPYTIRIYQQICHWVNKSYFYNMNFVAQKQMFGIEKKYPESSQFFQSIIKPAEIELRAKADVFFEVVGKIKEGRKTVGWRLKIHKKGEKNKELVEKLVTKKSLIYFLKARFLLKKVHLEILNDILSTKSLYQELDDKLNYLSSFVSKKQPKNVPAYIVACLIKEFANRCEEEEEEEEEEKSPQKISRLSQFLKKKKNA